MDKLTAIKIKKSDGSYSDQILISALAENVKYDGTRSVKDILELLDARINSITSLEVGSTTGDIELMDLRIGANGKSDYISAGQAVRSNINKLQELILIQETTPGATSSDGTTSWNKLWINNDVAEEIEIPTKDEFDILLNTLTPVNVLTWQSGDFNIDGTNHTNSNSIRSTNFIPDNIIGIMCSSNYKFCVWAWDKETGDHVGHLKEDGTFGQTSSYKYVTSFALDKTLGYKYKVTFYNENSTTNIVTSAGANCITYRDVTDTTLSLEGVAADAAAVGNVIAPVYNPSSAYNVGDYVNYNGTIYRCKTAIGSGGEVWTVGHWEATNISNKFKSVDQEVADLKSAVNDTTFDLTMIGTSNSFSNDKMGLFSVSLDSIDSYTTPEAYGAVGDGETDDSIAVQEAVDSDYDYIVFENTYLIKDINITKQKFLFFKDGSEVKPIYYDSSKQLFYNVFSTDKDLVVYGLSVTGDYNNTTVSQSNYTEPIILGDACDVFIYNSTFKDFKIRNRASSPNTLSDRRGIVATVINSGNLTINNCVFDNLNDEEWIQCLSNTQNGTIKIVNCQFKGGTGFSRITASAAKIIVKNNIFEDAVYNGSLVNCLGINCLLEGNVIKNCSITHVFDCSESTYFAKKVICKNNTIINKDEEAQRGCVLAGMSNVVLIDSNYSYGKPLCRLDYQTITGSTNIVVIKNNTLEEYYASNEISSANSWIPIYVIGTEGKNLAVSICNNSISLSNASVNIGQPIAIRSPTKVYIASNELFLAKATSTTAKYLTAILFNQDANNAIGYICNNMLSIDTNDSIDVSQYTKTYVKYPKDATYKVKQVNNILFGYAGTIEDSANNITV